VVGRAHDDRVDLLVDLVEHLPEVDELLRFSCPLKRGRRTPRRRRRGPRCSARRRRRGSRRRRPPTPMSAMFSFSAAGYPRRPRPPGRKAMPSPARVPFKNVLRSTALAHVGPPVILSRCTHGGTMIVRTPGVCKGMRNGSTIGFLDGLAAPWGGSSGSSCTQRSGRWRSSPGSCSSCSSRGPHRLRLPGGAPPLLLVERAGRDLAVHPVLDGPRRRVDPGGPRRIPRRLRPGPADLRSRPRRPGEEARDGHGGAPHPDSSILPGIWRSLRVSLFGLIVTIPVILLLPSWECSSPSSPR